MQAAPYGFRIVGPCTERRRLVDAPTALSGYAACDPRAEVSCEAYLSAFWFGLDFRQHLNLTGSTKRFDGPCWSPWLWFDIDREHDLEHAASDARRLCAWLTERCRLDGDELLLFFSGSKGFHVGVPTALWQPEPSSIFNRTARRFAQQAAETVGISIDEGVYDKVQAFRAPNSRHPKTGWHKRRLSFDELLRLKVATLIDMAAEPQPFDVPAPPSRNRQASADWQAAAEHVKQHTVAHQNRRAASNGATTLNHRTLDFICDGASPGDRHRLLYSAAANLAEFGCPAALAHALLTEAALDSGLPPKEVRRQIECGLNSAKGDQSR